MAIRIRIDSVPNGTKLAQNETQLVLDAGSVVPEQADLAQAIVISAVSVADLNRIRQVILMADSGLIASADTTDQTTLDDAIDTAFASI